MGTLFILMKDTKKLYRSRTVSSPPKEYFLGGFLGHHDIRMLLEQAPALIAILRGREGIVEVCNAQFRNAWGNKPVVGLPMRKAWPDLEPGGHFEYIERVYDTGQPIKTQERPGFIDRQHNGHLEEAFFNFTYTPFKAEDGAIAGVIMYGNDITLQVMAKRRAEQYQQRLDLLLATTQTGTWEWDLTTHSLLWSNRTKSLFGLAAHENTSLARYRSLVHPEDWAQVEQALHATQQQDVPFKAEHRIRWPDGQFHWILKQGVAMRREGDAVSIFGMAINIDAHKALYCRLQESEQRFRELADNAPMLIWMVDSRRQGFYFNRAWLHFTGRTRAQESGDGWTTQIHADDLATAMAIFNQAIEARESFVMEYRLLRHDGAYRWILHQGTPRFDGHGTLLGYIGTCIDIDEVKRGRELARMNTLLKKQRAQLVTINNAKDEFISIASHQLRTPASAVKQYVGLLLEGYVGELSDMQLKMVKAAYDSNQRQLGIIEALLRVAQVDAGKITPIKRTCDIVQLLEDIVREQQVKFTRRQQRLTYEHPQIPLIASVDQRLLRMVIENLIDNASKYSSDGKMVAVILRRKRTAIALQICDEGVGISVPDQSKLFQKFLRLSNPMSSLVSGSGLGLYWAKKIIDLHGGTITVESKEGKGSTFTITLPLN
jgi:PAS domain S-box-containing protein